MTENVENIEKDAAEAPETEEQTMESLLKEQSEQQEKLQKREVVWVKVIQADKEQVLVDVGEKSEAVIPASEFDEEIPSAGRRVPAVLVKRGRGSQPTLLSTAKAQWRLGWDQVCKSHEEKARVKGKVMSAIKGGFLVKVNGVTGFMPASLADLRPVRKPEAMVGTGVRCQIIELNKEKEQIILSRRAVLEEDAKSRRDKLVGQLKTGQVRIGRVMRVNEHGVFIDIGGLEGLVRTEDVSWKDPEQVRGKIARGQKLRVRVLKIDGDTQKVGLGLKQLTPHPAEAVRRKFPVKSVVKGKVSEVMADGVRIKLSKGGTAFCPVPELPVELAAEAEASPMWQEDRRSRPGAGRREGPPPIWPKEGDAVSAIVTGVHHLTFEAAVSIRRFEAIQDRKRAAQYMKEASLPNLGKLMPGLEQLKNPRTD